MPGRPLKRVVPYKSCPTVMLNRAPDCTITFAQRTQLLPSLAFFICLLSFFVPCLRAQQKTTEESAPIAYAVAVDRPPKLDGTLDDPLWQLSTPITDFRQQEPLEGQPATEKT